jgi:mannose-1-phosphate guanylyltransferase
LDYWLELLERHGVAEALVNLHHLPEAMEAYLSRQPYEVEVHTVYEPDLLGSAGTVVANRAWVEDEEAFFVIYADNLSNVDLTGLWACHQQHRPWLTMALFETPVPEQCGIAEVDETGRVVAFTEKPAQPRSNLANGGVYVVGREALRWMVEGRGRKLGNWEIGKLGNWETGTDGDRGTGNQERQITDHGSRITDHGSRITVFDFGHDVLPHFVGRTQGFRWSGYHLDIGTWETYEQAQQDVAEGKLGN